MTRIFIIVFIASILVQGCASPKVSVGMTMPARYSEAARYRRVAVLPFQGRDGREIARQLESRLVGVRHRSAPWFDVYERDRLKVALKELRLSSSGLVDSDTAARIGRFIGVRGIYMGSVNKIHVDSQSYREERRYCAEENKKGKCVRWADKTVYCKSKRAVFEFTPKLVDVETAHVVYSHLITRTYKTSACDDSRRPIETNDAMLDVVKQEALDAFIMDVAPYYRNSKITIKNDGEGLDGQAEKYFDAAVEFAKKDRLDRGCTLWEKALQAGGASMPLYYNLGVCSESEGDFDSADEWYRKADEQLLKPDEEVNQALKRMSFKRDARRKLHRQLR